MRVLSKSKLLAFRQCPSSTDPTLLRLWSKSPTINPDKDGDSRRIIGVTRMDSIRKNVPGGWDAFKKGVPNATLCADEEIARVGFMTPVDVEAFIKKLSHLGLEFLRDGAAVDVAVADQIRGITSSCAWLQFGRVPMGDIGGTVAACTFTGSKIKILFTPPMWQFDNSLSSTYAFVPNEHSKKGMQYLRHDWCSWRFDLARTVIV
jgi:hypothetical protein